MRRSKKIKAGRFRFNRNREEAEASGEKYGGDNIKKSEMVEMSKSLLHLEE